MRRRALGGRETTTMYHPHESTTLRIMRTLSTLLIVAALLVTAGCGGGDGGSSGSSAESGSTAVTEVTITPDGNKMKYEQTEFTVPAGKEITLTFKNTATSAAMKHNVVLLTTAEKSVVSRVGQAGTQAADNEYIPDDDAVLAATGLADPGETVSVTFTAPSDPGDYQYLCTFPGHYVSMQGTMTVVSSSGNA
jgi:azurin